MKKIAILGATSHIAKNLILDFDRSPGYEMTLFARDINRVGDFLKEHQCRPHPLFQEFSLFDEDRYDVIINCILNRDRSDHAVAPGFGMFETAEYFDNFVIDYLRRNRQSLFINFSSGAVYGGNFDKPVTWEQPALLPINQITGTEYYQAVKLYSEVKHRALTDLNIVDMRIFAFFSRFLPLDSHFFLANVISCLLENRVFETDANEIVRDYTHPDDLFHSILACMQTGRINAAFDLFSRSPVGKFELLDIFEREFGLKYRIVEKAVENVATGIKPVYCSENKSAVSIGFSPRFSSRETVLSETKALLSRYRSWS